VAIALVALGAAVALRGKNGRAAATPTPSAHIEVGGRAPEFTALQATTRPAEFRLAAQRGHMVVLSFLNTQAEPGGTENPSLGQIVFLKSMETQGRRSGLRTVVVDASGLVRKRAARRSNLINFTYDWALSAGIVVVRDSRDAIAREYGVSQVPTTLLIDKRGVVRDRWSGFASAAKLDFAILALEGKPIMRLSQATKR
jgi:cytochrome c biogenesis protein CcmG, thiol:disulfide interchange protein DsbE